MDQGSSLIKPIYYSQTNNCHYWQKPNAVYYHNCLLTSGIIIINLIMKKANIDIPSQKLKCNAMTIPKNAPTKCSAKYNAIIISFI